MDKKWKLIIAGAVIVAVLGLWFEPLFDGKNIYQYAYGKLKEKLSHEE